MSVLDAHRYLGALARMIFLRRFDSGYLPVSIGGGELINTDEPMKKIPCPE